MRLRLKLTLSSSCRRECIALLTMVGVSLSKSSFSVEAESTVFVGFDSVCCDLVPSATELVICGVALGLGGIVELGVDG